MTFKLKQTDGQWILELSGEVDLLEISELHQAIRDFPAKAAGDTIDIRTDELEETDISVPQLMIALKKEVESSGGKLTLTDPNAVWTSLAQKTCLSQMI